MTPQITTIIFIVCFFLGWVNFITLCVSTQYNYGLLLSYNWFKENTKLNIPGRIVFLVFLSIILFPYYFLKGLGWLFTTKKFDK